MQGVPPPQDDEDEQGGVTEYDDATDAPEWDGFTDDDVLADDDNATKEALSPAVERDVKPKPEKRSESRATEVSKALSAANVTPPPQLCTLRTIESWARGFDSASSLVFRPPSLCLCFRSYYFGAFL